MTPSLFDTVRRHAAERRSRLSSAVKSRLLRWIVGRSVVVPSKAETHDPEDLEQRTDALNQAAEVYFVEAEDPEYLIRKPFSAPSELAKYLFNLGVLVHTGRFAPGHRVLELGAGAGWVSHFLNLFGCPTVALDVSGTALELAEETFQRHPHTRWDLEPRFLTYDGHAIPLPDASIDRVVVHDAFHHIPNQREILRELARVLTPRGIVAMNEPGRHHSTSDASRHEMDSYGVLENDIVVEDLAKLARQEGFTRTTVVPINLYGATEVPAEELIEFVRGKKLAEWWCLMAPHLLNEHYIFLHKRPFVPDTRAPATLRADIAAEVPEGENELTARVGEPVTFRCRVQNTGDTIWLPTSAGRPGCTQLAVYLAPHPDDPDATVERDWHRVEIEQEVEPGETVSLDVELPPFEDAGERGLVLDMVAEGVTWFADVGSTPARVRLLVS